MTAPTASPRVWTYACLERSVDDGAWTRLGTTGWGSGADVQFAADAVAEYPENRCAFNDRRIEKEDPEKLEYRWVFFDISDVELGTTNCGTEIALAIYLDTPLISSITILESSPVADRGVTVRIEANTGTTTDEDDKVFEVKIWNEDSSAANVHWMRWAGGLQTGSSSTAREFMHVLSEGDGLKTVYAVVRNANLVESATDDVSINYAAAVDESVPAYSWTAGQICFGADSDDRSRVFIGDFYEADTDPDSSSLYPASLLTQNDVTLQWLAPEGDDGYRYGVSSVPSAGFTKYTTLITYDLGTERTIGFIGVFGHNFFDMAAIGDADYGMRVTAANSAIALDWDTPAPYRVDLTSQLVNDWPFLAHRPGGTAYRYWRFELFITMTDGLTLPPWAPDGWRIGRVVLAQSSEIWSPTESGVNFARGWAVEMRDPSTVATLPDGSIRAVEAGLRRSARLSYDLLNDADANALRTIYERHGITRPVVVVVDPANIGTGETPLYGDVPTIVYGYLDDTHREQYGVDRRDVDLRVEGPKL